MKCGWCRCTDTAAVKAKIEDGWITICGDCFQPMDSPITASEFVYYLRLTIGLDARKPQHVRDVYPEGH